MILESSFKEKLIKEIEKEFPGAIVLKNDPSLLQGIPDHLILFEDRWAAFEAKRSKKAKRQPNQEYYIELLNSMSFAAFVYPENEEDFLNELQSAFRSRRNARLFRR